MFLLNVSQKEVPAESSDKQSLLLEGSQDEVAAAGTQSDWYYYAEDDDFQYGGRYEQVAYGGWSPVHCWLYHHIK